MSRRMLLVSRPLTIFLTPAMLLGFVIALCCRCEAAEAGTQPSMDEYRKVREEATEAKKKLEGAIREAQNASREVNTHVDKLSQATERCSQAAQLAKKTKGELTEATIRGACETGLARETEKRINLVVAYSWGFFGTAIAIATVIAGLLSWGLTVHQRQQIDDRLESRWEGFLNDTILPELNRVVEQAKAQGRLDEAITSISLRRTMIEKASVPPEEKAWLLQELRLDTLRSELKSPERVLHGCEQLAEVGDYADTLYLHEAKDLWKDSPDRLEAIQRAIDRIRENMSRRDHTEGTDAGNGASDGEHPPAGQ